MGTVLVIIITFFLPGIRISIGAMKIKLFSQSWVGGDWRMLAKQVIFAQSSQRRLGGGGVPGTSIDNIPKDN